MSFLGKWKFDSILIYDENLKETYASAEEYMNSPMPSYINADNEEDVAHEKEQRQYAITTFVDVADDGKLYMLNAIPEKYSQAEIDEFVASGDVELRDGMMLSETIAWEEHDGELYYDGGIQGESDPWKKASCDDEKIEIGGIRFIKM